MADDSIPRWPHRDPDSVPPRIFKYGTAAPSSFRPPLGGRQKAGTAAGGRCPRPQNPLRLPSLARRQVDPGRARTVTATLKLDIVQAGRWRALRQGLEFYLKKELQSIAKRKNHQTRRPVPGMRQAVFATRTGPSCRGSEQARQGKTWPFRGSPASVRPFTQCFVPQYAAYG